jgi:hypothetical protein
MRVRSVLLATSLLMGQEEGAVPRPSFAVLAPPLKLRAAPLSPQDMLRAMLAQERVSRDQAGATVEVIGYEEGTALKLLSLEAAENTRLNFHIMDKQSQRELYAFMNQDPGHPTPVLSVPRLAGGKSSRA